MGRSDPNDDPLKLSNVSKRFNLSSKHAKGRIAKDRFAFDQTMQGHDCRKIRESGDFVVQKRDFFGNKVGEPTIYEVKTGNSPLSEAQEKRKRQLRSRYKVVRY
ncbi:MAG TPA: hypothetical protein VLU95_04890 [Candidatus Acidoferrum sp.]|nr:hypothetical protein [Candidatus Acidoferrum sp.]